MRVEFSDGSHEEFAVPTGKGAKCFKLKPVTTDWVKLFILNHTGVGSKDTASTASTASHVSFRAGANETKPRQLPCRRK